MQPGHVDGPGLSLAWTVGLVVWVAEKVGIPVAAAAAAAAAVAALELDAAVAH